MLACMYCGQKAAYRFPACSRAKCENGASTKIVLFVTAWKGVMDGERQKMNTSLWRREGGQQHSIHLGLTS